MPDEHLDEARAAYERRRWVAARDVLRAVDRREGLAPADLRRLGVASFMTGEPDEALACLERLHHDLLACGDRRGAVRWAAWLALLHVQQGSHAQGGGWLARAEALADDLDDDCPERGLLLVPAALQALDEGDAEAARDRFRRVTAVGRRAADAEVTVLGRLGEGQASVAMGAVDAGLARLDHAMVAVTTERVLPILAGIVYCAVVVVCRTVFDLRRASEWTVALTRWCDDQQSLKPFRGQCLVHRSEILQLHGRWRGAMTEVEAACAHFATVPQDPAAGMAQYQRAELLRLRGDLAAAERAYAEAAARGHEPQPGLALLRLAQGRDEDAAASIERVLDAAAADPVQRAAILPAHVEIMLARDEVDAAARSADELIAIATELGSTYLDGVAAHACAAVSLRRDDAASAAEACRTALRRWQQLDAPYEAARTRVLLAQAHGDLGDTDTATLHLAAARRSLTALGAAPALAEVAALTDGRTTTPAGLTPREVEVVRAVATGATNREVAEQLVISHRTVARHLSNVFAKLGVSSRAAATAWAYEHDLV